MGCKYPAVPFLWHTFGAYNVTFIITYIDVGFALLFRYQGQCEGLNSWNDNSRVPRFFCAVFDREKGVGNLE